MDLYRSRRHLYSPLRLCNAYRLDDQQRLGTELVRIVAVVGVAWLVQAFRRSM
jgi:hypothetical protein